MSFITDIVPAFGGLIAATLLHLVLLDNLMRAPLSFYDVTPVGRLLSRFSKDIETVDDTLPRTFNDGIWCAFEVILQKKNLILRCMPQLIH